MPKHLKIFSDELVSKNPFWEFRKAVFEKPNGAKGDYYYAKTPGLAMVVPVLPDGRLILVVQFRVLEQKISIEFPGGGIKNNQTPQQTAEAELKEETGWLSDDFIKMGAVQPSNGLTDDKMHIFLTYVTEQTEQKLDDSEEIEVIYRKPEEIDDMIQKNEIWCGETLSAWALVRDRLKR